MNKDLRQQMLGKLMEHLMSCTDDEFYESYEAVFGFDDELAVEWREEECGSTSSSRHGPEDVASQ